jgi:hypothetical protein
MFKYLLISTLVIALANSQQVNDVTATKVPLTAEQKQKNIDAINAAKQEFANSVDNVLNKQEEKLLKIGDVSVKVTFNKSCEFVMPALPKLIPESIKVCVEYTKVAQDFSNYVINNSEKPNKDHIINGVKECIMPKVTKSPKFVIETSCFEQSLEETISKLIYDIETKLKAEGITMTQADKDEVANKAAQALL